MRSMNIGLSVHFLEEAPDKNLAPTLNSYLPHLISVTYSKSAWVLVACLFLQFKSVCPKVSGMSK